MFLWPKLSGIFAAFGMLVLIALAPSAASAHAGHHHAASIEQASPAKVGVAAEQEVRSTDIVIAQSQHDHGCGDRGCCGNGHCAGCVIALLPSTIADFGDPEEALRLSFDAVVPPGLGTSGPPRPPRSFV